MTTDTPKGDDEITTFFHVKRPPFWKPKREHETDVHRTRTTMAQNSQYRGKMVKQNEVVYVAIPMNNADDDGVNNFHDEDIDGGKAPPAIYTRNDNERGRTTNSSGNSRRPTSSLRAMATGAFLWAFIILGVGFLFTTLMCVMMPPPPPIHHHHHGGGGGGNGSYLRGRDGGGTGGMGDHHQHRHHGDFGMRGGMKHHDGGMKHAMPHDIKMQDVMKMPHHDMRMHDMPPPPSHMMMNHGVPMLSSSSRRSSSSSSSSSNDSASNSRDGISDGWIAGYTSHDGWHAHSRSGSSDKMSTSGVDGDVRNGHGRWNGKSLRHHGDRNKKGGGEKNWKDSHDSASNDSVDEEEEEVSADSNDSRNEDIQSQDEALNEDGQDFQETFNAAELTISRMEEEKEDGMIPGLP